MPLYQNDRSVPWADLRFQNPPPPSCKSTTLVRTTGIVFTLFGTNEFGGSLFRWSMKTKFSLRFGAGDDFLGTLIAVLPPAFTSSCPRGGGDWGIT